MKLIFHFLILSAIFSTSAWARMAERMPDQSGSVDTYFSDNGKYELSITHGEPLASWSLKENGKVLWSEPLMNEPGNAAVSDNGETITLPVWGWRDEGGSSGVAVFNKNGVLVREVLFKGDLPGTETLRWVRERRLSPDGKYFIIGENGKESAHITLFKAATGEIVWEKRGGFPEIVQLKIAGEGKYALAATREDNGSGMEFLLLDRSGTALWRKIIAHNLSYEVKHYVRFMDDGSGFEIYDLKSGRYLSEKIP